MNRTTSLMIGASAFALLVVCSGLGGVIAFRVSRRAEQEQLAQQQAREASARAEAAAEAERQREVLELARAEAERAAAAAAQGTPPAGAAGDRSALVQAAVRGATSGARRCYARALRRQPDLAVRADVAITYGLDGGAEEVQVGLGELAEGPIREQLEHCLDEVFSATRIPAGTETLSVSVPLVFQAG